MEKDEELQQRYIALYLGSGGMFQLVQHTIFSRIGAPSRIEAPLPVF